MNEYEQLNSLNELADRLLGSLGSYNDHLLYQSETFMDISKQIRPLISKVRNMPNTVAVTDKQRKEAIERATKLQTFFELVNTTKEKMDALDNDGERQTKETVEKDALAYEYMVKLKIAIADIKACAPGGKFSDGIDPIRLRAISKGDVTKSGVDLETGYVGLMTNLFLGEERSANRDKARQALKNGTIQQHLRIKSVDGELVSSIQTNPVKKINELVSSKNVKEAINRYRQAEKYWLESNLTDEEERASRRAFMETYADDLNGLYQAMNVNTIPNADKVRSEIIKYLNENELTGMMRDYSNMLLDRDGSVAKQEPWSYLFTKEAGMKKAEIDFRAIPTTNSVYDYSSNELNAAQKEGLKEFHKWIYRNCDKTGLGEAFGANGSARDYMEDFMKAPYETQIKTLYLLETKSRRNGRIPDVNSKEFKEYVPNLDKLKDVMVSSKFKFWQRLNGKKHRWNKIKDCMDRITKNAVIENKKSQPWTDAYTAGRTAAGLVSSPMTIIDKESGVTTGSVVVGDVIGAMQGFSAIKSSIKKLAEGKNLTKREKGRILLDGTQGVANVLRSGASTYSKTKLPYSSTIAADAAKHLGGGINVLLAGRAAYDVVKYTGRNGIFNKGLNKIIKENENKEFDEDEKEALLNKLKKHGKILKSENKAKAVDRGLDIIAPGINSVGYGIGALTAISAMPIALTASGIATPIIIAIKNKLAMKGIRKTIDADLYENAEKKKEALSKIRENINKRLRRLPASKAYDKVRESLLELRDSESRLLHHIRKNEARKNGCVNEKQLKNLIVSRTKEEDKKMYFMEEPEATDDVKKRNLIGLAKAGAGKLLSLSSSKMPERPEAPAEEAPAVEANEVPQNQIQ